MNNPENIDHLLSAHETLLLELIHSAQISAMAMKLISVTFANVAQMFKEFEVRISRHAGEPRKKEE
jgi:hypothetical protein